MDRVSYSIGIIGGADGPTAVFVTGNPFWVLVPLLLAIVALFFIVTYFRKK